MPLAVWRPRSRQPNRRSIRWCVAELIAQILGDVAVKAMNDLRARLLVYPHDLAHVLRVQRPRKRRRTHKITEHHRELTAFGFGGNTGRCLWPTERPRRLGGLNGFDCDRQYLPTLVTESVRGRVRSLARGTEHFEPSPACSTKLHPGRILVLAPGTLQIRASSEPGQFTAGSSGSRLAAEPIPVNRADPVVCGAQESCRG